MGSDVKMRPYLSPFLPTIMCIHISNAHCPSPKAVSATLDAGVGRVCLHGCRARELHSASQSMDEHSNVSLGFCWTKEWPCTWPLGGMTCGD